MRIVSRSSQPLDAESGQAPRPGRLARRRGFSLVEVVISVVILGMAVMILMVSMSRNMQLDELNRERAFVREECRKQLDTILARPFVQLTTLNGSTFDVGWAVATSGGGAVTYFLKPPAGAAKVGSIIVDSTSFGDTTCYKITITARWRTSVMKGNTSILAETVTANVADY